MAFYDQSVTTLWTTQEEDPALVRYVIEAGCRGLFGVGSVPLAALTGLQSDLLDGG